MNGPRGVVLEQDFWRSFTFALYYTQGIAHALGYLGPHEASSSSGAVYADHLTVVHHKYMPDLT